MKIFKAFTLAEVLITLGIIGVVAAMTMPTLINQTNGAQYKAAFKKSLSAISQAATLNASLEDMDFADLNVSSYTIEQLLKDRMNVVKTKGLGELSSTNYTPKKSVSNALLYDKVIFFNDGSMLGYFEGFMYSCIDEEHICGASGTAFIDVNGLKGPNKEVACDIATNTREDSVSSSGVITKDNTACTVSHPTDIYRVFIYDQTIVPSTNAGRAVLYGK